MSRLELVRPKVLPHDPEVVRWACGADRLLSIRVHDSLETAAHGFRTVVATASARGRERQPVIGPREVARELSQRGPEEAALVFGNETSGLNKDDMDRCDLTVRIPTHPQFPVLNVTQAVAILLAYLSIELEPEPLQGPPPATLETVDALMDHLRSSLLAIGFLDCANPDRILRQLRRVFGRAAVTDNEVAILRGICRQMEWAARNEPLGPGDRNAVSETEE